jgi:hypothetical protein
MFEFIIPVLLVITSAGVPAPQASTASEFASTGGLPNGRFWSRRTQQEKIVWLFGYSDGIKTAAAFVSGAEPTDKLLQQFVLDLQPTDKLTTTETVEGIDHFYQDVPENALVPVAGALNYVKTKAKGAKQFGAR